MEVSSFVELLEKNKPAGGGLFDNVIMITMNNQKMISVDDNNRDKMSIDGTFIKIENDNFVYAMGYDFRPRKVVEYHDIFLIEGVVFAVTEDDLLETKGFINDYDLEFNKPTGGIDGRIFGMVKQGEIATTVAPKVEVTEDVTTIRVGEELPSGLFTVKVGDTVLSDSEYRLMKYGSIDVKKLGVQTMMVQAIDLETNLVSDMTTITVDVIGWVAPTITLKGDATIYVELGSTFKDPGVTAVDPDGKALTPTVTGTVDTNTLSKYTIKYSASYGLSPVSEVTRKVIVRDTTKPVITLNGDASMSVEINTEFTDPGVVVSDNSADTVEATVTGTVDTSTLGTYTLKYDAVDGSGNSSSVERTVVVEDTIAPVITLKGTKTMTIQLGGTFTDQGATVTDNSGETLTAVVSGATVDTNTVGTYKVNYDATDSSGNKATRVIRTVKVVDSVKPVITLNGGADIWIQVGPKAKYEELGATVTDNSGETITAVVGGDTVNPQVKANYIVTYDATDSSGNQADQVSRTVHVMDSTKPVITLTGDAAMTVDLNGAFTDPGVTVTDNSGETLTAVVGGDTVDTATAAEYVITYDATDSSGNKAVQVTRTVTVVDNTPAPDPVE